MDFNQYKKISIFLYAVIGPLLIFRNHFNNLEIIVIFIVILSVCSIYLNLFVFFQKRKIILKKNCLLVTFSLTISFILLLCGFSLPILSYFSFSKNKDAIFNANKYEIQKIESFRPGKNFDYEAAKLYFRKTGEKIEYIKNDETKAIYSPDIIDIAQHKNFYIYYQLKSRKVHAVNLIYLNIGIILIFGVVFFCLIGPRTGDRP